MKSVLLDAKLIEQIRFFIKIAARSRNYGEEMLQCEEICDKLLKMLELPEIKRKKYYIFTSEKEWHERGFNTVSAATAYVKKNKLTYGGIFEYEEYMKHPCNGLIKQI